MRNIKMATMLVCAIGKNIRILFPKCYRYTKILMKDIDVVNGAGKLEKVSFLKKNTLAQTRVSLAQNVVLEYTS